MTLFTDNNLKEACGACEHFPVCAYKEDKILIEEQIEDTLNSMGTYDTDVFAFELSCKHFNGGTRIR